MKNIFFLVVLALLSFRVSVSGQSDPQFSQYMFCVESYNPSVLANYTAINLVGMYRQQWVGIPNAPKTFFAAANMPFNAFLNKKQGIGIAFVNDNFGIFSNESVNLQYALQFKLGDGSLSTGLNIGYISQTIAGDSVRIVQSDYHDISGDLAIPKQSVSDVAADFGLGVMYSAPNYYVGLSVLHLFQPTLDLEEYVTSYIGRSAYLVGGYDFPLRNIRYVLKPSVLLKSDFISWQTDLSVRLEKDEKYWLGISWRLQDAIVIYGGLNLLNGLFVGYSYDLSTSRLIAYSSGSHEVVLRYSLNLGKKKLNKYKSVRVL